MSHVFKIVGPQIGIAGKNNCICIPHTMDERGVLTDQSGGIGPTQTFGQASLKL